MNTLYPVFLKVKQLHLLLIGAGDVALEKLTFLLKSSPDAQVHIVAQEVLNDQIQGLLSENITLEIAEFDAHRHLKNIHMVIDASNNPPHIEQLVALCRAQHLLINVADNPDYCDFYMGSIVTQGDLKIAISTNGKSPTLAKRMRQLFEELFHDNIHELLQNLNQYRKTLKGNFNYKVDKLNELTQQIIKQ